MRHLRVDAEQKRSRQGVGNKCHWIILKID
ncbi:hypothetical protein GALL_518490 [mine drainage metagenome]|uniref:Uncharacterized protein n=1 Tax=mine drainage metagenome TaxID=410659 RepID=A0A1J5PSN7_9ZZZZ